MAPLYLLLLLSLSFVNASQNNTLSLEEESLDDLIVEIFNFCKCVIFYRCDEDNMVIPENQLQHYVDVIPNKTLRSVPRIKCSNEFYYCCKNKNETKTPSSTTSFDFSTLPPVVPATSFSHSHCGQSGYAASSRVIEKFPWVTAIYQKRTTRGHRFVCGGSLIHPTVVMTDRNCVQSHSSDDFKVSVRRETLDENVTLLPISEIIKEGVHGNIALIVLQKPVTNARTVCLPTLDQNFAGRRCTTVAWSAAAPSGERSLRKSSLLIVDSHRCQNTSLGLNSQLDASYMCTESDDEEGTCGNVGGSPLMCKENGRYVQVGSAKWGLRCGQRDVPSVYVNVANSVAWVQQKLREF